MPLIYQKNCWLAVKACCSCQTVAGCSRNSLATLAAQQEINSVKKLHKFRVRWHCIVHLFCLCFLFFFAWETHKNCSCWHLHSFTGVLTLSFSLSPSLCLLLCLGNSLKQLKVAAIWQPRLKCAVNTRLMANRNWTEPSELEAASWQRPENGNNRKPNIYTVAFGVDVAKKGLRWHLWFRLRWQRAR